MSVSQDPATGSGASASAGDAGVSGADGHHSSGRGPCIWVPWRKGPVTWADGPVLVSLTIFRPHRKHHWPGIALAGLRLREGWYAMPGAVGLWLWNEPLAGRGGSVSVWNDEADLRRFIALPVHLAIMRHYRSRGVTKSDTWRMDSFSPGAARAEAQRRLGMG